MCFLFFVLNSVHSLRLLLVRTYYSHTRTPPTPCRWTGSGGTTSDNCYSHSRENYSTRSVASTRTSPAPSENSAAASPPSDRPRGAPGGPRRPLGSDTTTPTYPGDGDALRWGNSNYRATGNSPWSSPRNLATSRPPRSGPPLPLRTDSWPACYNDTWTTRR